MTDKDWTGGEIYPIDWACDNCMHKNIQEIIDDNKLRIINTQKKDKK